MKKVWIFSALLIAGLVLSQVMPGVLGEQTDPVQAGIGFLTMVGLAFIMIHVGYEFDLDKGNLRRVGAGLRGGHDGGDVSLVVGDRLCPAVADAAAGLGHL